MISGVASGAARTKCRRLERDPLTQPQKKIVKHLCIT